MTLCTVYETIGRNKQNAMMHFDLHRFSIISVGERAKQVFSIQEEFIIAHVVVDVIQ